MESASPSLPGDPSRPDPSRPDPWIGLRAHTAARIALGRAGGSLPTRELLDFNLAHARARDAVQAELDLTRLAGALAPLGLPLVTLASAAGTRLAYLQRPDLGRRLAPDSREELQRLAANAGAPDLVVIVSCGLSAPAAQRQAPPLLNLLIPRLHAEQWQLAPLVIVPRGRVAIEDEIGELLQARLALILLGERPGLSSPDSLGAYLVHTPRPGRTDADRNCVSNIRPEGLSLDAAAETLHYLLTASRVRGLSGIALKDERGGLAAPEPPRCSPHVSGS